MDDSLKIKSIYRDISYKEKKVADYILAQPETVIHLSIRELALEVGVAESTIFRFAKKIGYTGFKDFKIGLSTSVSMNKHEEGVFYKDISKMDSPKTIADKVIEANIKSLRDSSKLLKDNDIDKAVSYLANSNKVFFFGIGGSSAVAVDAYYQFLRSPIEVSCDVDSHIQLMTATKMGKNDCAIIISHTGKTKEVITIAKEVKRNKGKLIVVTSFPLSPLAELADVCLLSISSETEYILEATASRISQYSIIDALFVNVMYVDQESFEKTTKQVRDIIKLTKEP
jgi:RpiR family transcriptional regulator, carbohydrate utilization regulator